MNKNQRKLYPNPFIQYSCLMISVILYPFYILKIIASYIGENIESIVGLIAFIFFVYDAYTIYRNGYDLIGDTLIIFFVLILMSAVNFVGGIVSAMFIIGLSYPVRLYESALHVYREESMKKKLGPVEYEKRLSKRAFQSTILNMNGFYRNPPYL